MGSFFLFHEHGEAMARVHRPDRGVKINTGPVACWPTMDER